MNKTLVILAAGIGSRFGTGIKQLTPIDNNNHLIIDYSIHNAIAAGFDVGGKMNLPPHGKENFARHGKQFFTCHGKEFFTS